MSRSTSHDTQRIFCHVCAVRHELREFRSWLGTQGYADATCDQYARVIGALANELGLLSLNQLPRRLASLVVSVRSRPSNKARRTLDNVLALYVDMRSPTDDAGRWREFRKSLISSFAQRKDRPFHLSEHDVGGSNLDGRVKPYFTWSSGDAMLRGAADMAGPLVKRDVALVGLLVRSGLKPQEIRRLRWQDLAEVLEIAARPIGELAGITDAKGRVRVMHADALRAVYDYWREQAATEDG